MFLVLCSSFDYPALWVHQCLADSDIGPVKLVTEAALASATRWDHRISSSEAKVSFVLPDDSFISDRNLGGVLNRLIAPPEQAVRQAVPEDRDYASQEMTAFHLSWLHGLPCPVLNRPTPQGLAGRWFHTSECVLMAHAAGLPVLPYLQTWSDAPDAGYGSLAPAGVDIAQCVVLDDELFGQSLPENIHHACLAFAAKSQTRLLGIDLFRAGNRDWTFASATPLPDLQIGGAALIAKLVRTLRSGT